MKPLTGYCRECYDVRETDKGKDSEGDVWKCVECNALVAWREY